MIKTKLFSTEGLKIPQIRYCVYRCKKCNCQFTCTILDDDVPIATFCFSCVRLYHYSKKQQQEFTR